MRYRQWKKNYKKRYGVNPPANRNKRKRRKRRRQVARAAHVLANTDLGATLNRVAESMVNGLTDALRTLGGFCDIAGTVFRTAADCLQPLEIRGSVFSWEVREYGADSYAVYEKNALGGDDELRTITYSRTAAEKIAEILRVDQMEYTKVTRPERIQRRNDAADGLQAAFVAAEKMGAYME